MSETTTKEHAATPGLDENLVDAAARAAEELKAKSLATIRPDQQRWDENQLAILRALGVEDATQADVDLFFHYCRTTGLDPFRKQIYMIGRNTKVTEWVEDDRAENGRRKVEKWVTKYTIQTGIDGYRNNGREAAKANGDELSVEGPYFTGKDDFIVTDEGKVIQLWREVWHLDTPPHAAKYIVYRNGEAFPGVIRYDEFVQTVPIYEGYGRDRKKVGERPNENWAKSPCNQTAKCAEALSWRRAYPDDFAGLILEDSAQPTVIDQDGNVESEPEKRRPAGGSGIGGVRAARERKQKKQRAADVVDGEVISEATDVTTQQETRAGDGDTNEAETDVENTTAAARPGAEGSDLNKSARAKLNGAIFATFGELGLNGDDEEKRKDRLVVIREIVGRELESSKELTLEELQTLRNSLISRKQAGTLDADVTEWLNIETLRQDAAAAAAEDPGPGDGDTTGADAERTEP